MGGERGLDVAVMIGQDGTGYDKEIKHKKSLLIWGDRASPALPGDEGVSGWLSPPYRIFRDQVGSTRSRARQHQRELRLQRERRVKLTHDMYLIHTWKCRSLSFIFIHPPEELRHPFFFIKSARYMLGLHVHNLKG